MPGNGVTGTGLKVVAVGSGRDGTLSVNMLLHRAFNETGMLPGSCHEYESGLLYDLYSNYLESGEGRYLGEIRKALRSCPYAAIVGNGYAPILGELLALFPDVKFIHLRRRDRDACVKSLVRALALARSNVYYFNQSEVGGPPRQKRWTAFHFEEVTKSEWEAWAIDRRVAWYYDKTHALIDGFTATRQAPVLDVATEELSSPGTLARLSSFVFGKPGLLREPVHINRSVYADMNDVPLADRGRVHFFMQDFDIAEMVTDDSYLLRYSASKSMTWLSHMISGLTGEISREPRKTDDEILAFARQLREIFQQHQAIVDAVILKGSRPETTGTE